MASCEIKLNHIQNLPASFFITAKVEIHGLYNKAKIKNDIALAPVKLIKLALAVNVIANALVEATPFAIVKIDKINSFAKTPTIKAHKIPALLSPIGAKIKLNLFAKKYNILSVISSV